MMTERYYRTNDGQIFCGINIPTYYDGGRTVLGLSLRDGEWVFRVTRVADLAPLSYEEEVRYRMFGR